MEVDWIEIKGRKYAKKVINKGWSDDKKYCITDEEGNRFLLRLSPRINELLFKLLGVF